MDWHDTDPSDDGQDHQDDPQTTSRKRSSRACDQCRKTKSKCERPTGDAKKCKSCALAGTPCTYLGPSYKRGPPKGYIHAIEQRWHQVESLLGAILQCPDSRVQGIVHELRQDDLAREILGRVDTGPYGPSGRRKQPADATKEDFFASIMRSNEEAQGDSSRARRQSRVSREIVSSNQDHGLSVVPTKEWQDNLSRRLALGSSSGTRLDAGGPVLQRRRLNSNSDSQLPTNWNTLYTIEQPTESDDFKAATEGMHQLSLDENQEVRFHGQASGLHLLGRNERTDDRMEGGIWRLPMARVWPPSKFGITTYPHAHHAVDLPPQDIQDELLSLYFTNIHPIFPVVHKTRFLAEYQTRKQNDGRDIRASPATSASSTFTSPRPEPTQEVTPLLLFAIFAIAARFTEEGMPHPLDNKMWEAGCGYLESARAIITRVYHISRPSTVQSLLLLGYREFGIGSMEQGWIFIGTAIRMAYDLGLNCDSGKWKMHGHDLFSPQESQARRQIWWACCLTDRYGSVYMGRPIMIKDEDFETPLPNVDPVEERQPWQPTLVREGVVYPPVPSRIMSAFCASSRLMMIVGSIVSQIYPVHSMSTLPRQAMLADLESRLDQWYITLPEELRYDGSSKKITPPPQILFTHLRYWGAVLLLHRAFIPNWKGCIGSPQRSTDGMRAFDLAHSAACHIASIVTVYRETFTMKRTSPFLTSYLLSGAVMHILTLTLQPENFEAGVGLEQCMTALKEMEIVWPSASRAWDLLNGVQLRTHAHLPASIPTQYQYSDRNKRPAEDAFGEDKAPDYLQREVFGAPESTENVEVNTDNTTSGVQDISTRLMAHMLGLEVPGVEPSTSYYPGYEWWPRMNQGSSQLPQTLPYSSSTTFTTNDMQAMNSGAGSGNGTGSSGANWAQNTPLQPSMIDYYGINNLNYPYDFGQYAA
ncbi:fungal-specific transcription factor domain-containing protein [Crassisporium funariophilum]|nr:fungal-specific transcription factor domain-containing protein [Crassisporium funariophilum]